MDLIIGGIEFTSADLDYSGVTSREFMLKRALAKLNKEYDFCIIDCSPTLALITQNVLAITDKIVVPMTPEAFATNGANMLFSWISVMSERLNNPNLDVAGILVTNCRNTNNANQTFLHIEKEQPVIIQKRELKLLNALLENNSLSEKTTKKVISLKYKLEEFEESGFLSYFVGKLFLLLVYCILIAIPILFLILIFL